MSLSKPMSAVATAEAVRQGRLTPLEAVEGALARIAAQNPALNAVVNVLDEPARAAAADISRRLSKGEDLPLAGVPVLVKDTIFVKDTRVSQGSRLFADFVAPSDAIAVERLKSAGAIIVGIANSPEFAVKGVTNSPFHGPAHHPMNTALTPGGSSGGNAAALMAGLAPLGVGTDAGGSGRRPAAHCGVVGFKPSFGAIPYGPGFPEAFWNIPVIAPMARDVADTALLFSALSGLDPRDPDSIHLDPPEAGAALRIAYSPRFGLDVPMDEDVVATTEAAVAALEKAGWTIERADPVWPEGARETALMPLQQAGLAMLFGEEWHKDASRFDPDVAAQIEAGLRFSGADVALALETGLRVRRAVASFLNSYDLLIGPTTPCVAWPHTQLGPTHIGGVAVPPRGHAVFTPLFNHALVPAISIPCGKGRDGLPVGLQMIMRRGRDHALLAAAAKAESALVTVNAGV